MVVRDGKRKSNKSNKLKIYQQGGDKLLDKEKIKTGT